MKTPILGIYYNVVKIDFGNESRPVALNQRMVTFGLFKASEDQRTSCKGLIRPNVIHL